MSKLKTLTIFIVAYSILFLIFGYTNKQNTIPAPASLSNGKMYIYGESHGVAKIKDKEIEIWEGFYNNKGLRHLFLEQPYYTAELLNIWMKSEDDDILNQIYNDWHGVKHRNSSMKNFYIEIKNRFPETIFHGTDVGHQYHSIGKRYLNYLRKKNMENSLQYHYAKKIIEQGKYYYKQNDPIYRENMMVANFIHEFNSLDNENIMGIYGAAHIGINSLNHTNSVPSMANQLNKVYPNQIVTENLNYSINYNSPIRRDIMLIKGYNYEAIYFGRNNLTGFKDFEYRDFWRLEDAYDKFNKTSKTGDVLPYGNYPMKIETGQVFVIDYMKSDCTVIRKYYRSDGNFWRNKPTTEEFIVK